MPAGTIGTSMNFGFSGELAGGPDNYTESKVVKSNSATINFGEAVILNTDNTFSSVNSVTLTAANFAGVAKRSVQQATSYTSPNGAGGYPASTMADVLQRGKIMVPVGRGGALAAGGAVYVRTALNTAYPASLIGDFETASDAGKNVLLTNACWDTGIADGKNMAVLKLKYINN